jgi:hypothetical protein
VKLRYKNFARGCNLKKFFNTTKGIFTAEEKFEKNNKREMMKARFHTKPHIFIKELKRKVWKLEDKFHVCFFFFNFELEKQMSFRNYIIENRWLTL